MFVCVLKEIIFSFRFPWNIMYVRVNVWMYASPQLQVLVPFDSTALNFCFLFFLKDLIIHLKGRVTKD